MDQAEDNQTNADDFKLKFHLTITMKDGHKRCELGFLKGSEPRTFKSISPHGTREEVCEAYRERQEIGEVPQVFDHDYLSTRFAYPVTLRQELNLFFMRSYFMGRG